jgi:hypothetical protein
MEPLTGASLGWFREAAGQGTARAPASFDSAKETIMDNRRTETARENDDSDLIDRDSAEPAPSQGGSFGGNLQEDIATQAELDRVRDPEARDGVDKQDDIDHQQRYQNRHPADKSSGGNPSE